MTSSGCHSVKVISIVVGYSMFVMVTNLCCHLTYDSRGASSTRIIFEMLPEIHTMETRDFLQYIIHSQIYTGYLLFRGEYQTDVPLRVTYTFYVTLAVCVIESLV